MKTYDVVVIGAGPGGYVCAIRAAQLGLKTAIVDKRWLGGVCLNVGCIPTKALLKNADVALTLREKGRDYGFSFDNLVLDYEAAVKRSRAVSDRLTRGVGYLMKKNEIDVYMGMAQIKAQGLVAVTTQDDQVEELAAKHIVIATGTHAGLIPGVALVENKVLTYHEAILQTHLPKSVVIIGGGALGSEFATIWNAYGAKVTIVEMLPRLLPLEDEDISNELMKAYKKRGITSLVGHRLESITCTDAGVQVNVSAGEDKKAIDAEQVLIAIGFKPNTANLGLENAGVNVTERGFIAVDERMATNVPGIWAIGDVTGKMLLAHVASAQGMLCAEALAGMPTEALDYRMIPRATYSHPQVASFGLTQKEAEAQGYALSVGTFPFLANGKALGLGEQNGFVKLIVDEKTHKLLGGHLIGADVSELLPELTLAQQEGLSISAIARNIHAHPTLSEALMEAAHAVEGRAIHM